MIKKTALSVIVLALAMSGSVKGGIHDGFGDDTSLQNYLLANNINPQLLENYVLLSNRLIKKISSSDESVVRVKILTTVMNERNTVVIKSVSIGEAVITADMGNGTEYIVVKVRKNGTMFKTDCADFEFVPLDFPPEVMEIDAPPDAGGV